MSFFRVSASLLIVFLTSAFTIRSLAQQAELYDGRLVYVSVDPVSYSIDSTIIYYSKSRILLITQPGEESKTPRYRRIADLSLRKQFWILDDKKLVLEERLPDEFSKRAFEELPGTQQVQNAETRTILSELTFPLNSGKGLESYTLKLSVAGLREAALVPEQLYLVDYGFYKGRLIVKFDSDAFFPENKDSRRVTQTLMVQESSVQGPSSAVPAGYTVKPFTTHEFLTSFERASVDQLIRFYLDGSLKN